MSAEETPQGAEAAGPGASERWGELAGRLEGVLAAEQGGGAQGSLPGADGPMPPQGLPELNRIAQLAERLEAVLASPPQAAYNPVASPTHASRAEEVLPGPTSFPGMPTPQAAWHGGAPLGIESPSFIPPTPPEYEQQLGAFPAAPPLVQLPPSALEQPPLLKEGAPPWRDAELPGMPAPPQGMAFTFPAVPPPSYDRANLVAGLGATVAAPVEFPRGMPPERAEPSAVGWDVPGAPPFAASAFDFVPAPPPVYAHAASLLGGSAPVAAGVGDWPHGAAPGAEGGGTGGFPSPGEAPYAAHDLAGILAGGAPPAEFGRLPMGGEAREASGGAGQGQDGGKDEQGGVIGELRTAIQELRQSVSTLGERKGPKERRPGPQTDGSFVPSSIFGGFPSDYERHS